MKALGHSQHLCQEIKRKIFIITYRFAWFELFFWPMHMQLWVSIKKSVQLVGNRSNHCYINSALSCGNGSKLSGYIFVWSKSENMVWNVVGGFFCSSQVWPLTQFYYFWFKKLMCGGQINKAIKGKPFSFYSFQQRISAISFYPPLRPLGHEKITQNSSKY